MLLGWLFVTFCTPLPYIPCVCRKKQNVRLFATFYYHVDVCDLLCFRGYINKVYAMWTSPAQENYFCQQDWEKTTRWLYGDGRKVRFTDGKCQNGQIEGDYKFANEPMLLVHNLHTTESNELGKLELPTSNNSEGSSCHWYLKLSAGEILPPHHPLPYSFSWFVYQLVWLRHGDQGLNDWYLRRISWLLHP